MTNKRVATRSATVLVCVLVCLMVAISLAGSAVHAALRARREILIENQMRQTEFLLEAGIARAAEKWRSDPEFASETWRPTGLSERFGEPLVTMRVITEHSGDSPHIEVIARLGSQERVSSATQKSHRFAITKSTSQPSE